MIQETVPFFQNIFSPYQNYITAPFAIIKPSRKELIFLYSVHWSRRDAFQSKEDILLLFCFRNNGVGIVVGNKIKVSTVAVRHVFTTVFFYKFLFWKWKKEIIHTYLDFHQI